MKRLQLEDKHLKNLTPGFLRSLQAFLGARTIFPRLHSLDSKISDSGYSSSSGSQLRLLFWENLRLFLSPSLRHLSLSLFESHKSLRPTRDTILHQLGTICPDLRSVTMLSRYTTSGSASDEGAMQAISSCIGAWGNLHALEVPNLEDDALNQLATLPFLQDLAIIGGNLSSAGASSSLPRKSFLPLRKLKLVGECHFIRNLVSAMAMQQLVDLDLTCQENFSQELVAEIFAIFGTGGKHLTSVTIDSLHGHRRNAEVDRLSVLHIRPLLNCTKLRVVKLVLPLTLDNSAMEDMASAWPLLQSLTLGQGGDLEFGHPSILALKALVTKCPKLSHCDVPLDPEDVPDIKDPAYRGARNHILQTFVGRCPTLSPVEVAAYLSSLFTNIRSFESEYRTSSSGWGQVARLYPYFVHVRRQENPLASGDIGLWNDAGSGNFATCLFQVSFSSNAQIDRQPIELHELR